jgi:hypothetical protein
MPKCIAAMLVASGSGAKLNAIFLPNVSVIDYAMHFFPCASENRSQNIGHERFTDLY